MMIELKYFKGEADNRRNPPRATFYHHNCVIDFNDAAMEKMELSVGDSIGIGRNTANEQDKSLYISKSHNQVLIRKAGRIGRSDTLAYLEQMKIKPRKGLYFTITELWHKGEKIFRLKPKLKKTISRGGR